MFFHAKGASTHASAAALKRGPHPVVASNGSTKKTKTSGISKPQSNDGCVNVWYSSEQMSSLLAVDYKYRLTGPDTNGGVGQKEDG